jgi:hypothetical protein
MKHQHRYLSLHFPTAKPPNLFNTPYSRSNLLEFNFFGVVRANDLCNEFPLFYIFIEEHFGCVYDVCKWRVEILKILAFEPRPTSNRRVGGAIRTQISRKTKLEMKRLN